jgi:hypothetical protein
LPIGECRFQALLDNDEFRMPNGEGMSNPECPTGSSSFAGFAFVIRIWDLFGHWKFVIRHSSFIVIADWGVDFIWQLAVANPVIHT